jgi:hypothetical protein
MVNLIVEANEKSRVLVHGFLKTKKPRASVCPRLEIRLDDPSTHGQTPPVEIKIKELPGLIDMLFNCHHHRFT